MYRRLRCLHGASAGIERDYNDEAARVALRLGLAEEITPETKPVKAATEEPKAEAPKVEPKPKAKATPKAQPKPRKRG